MSDVIVDFSQYTTDIALNGPYSTSDNVTLADDSSVLDELTDAQIDSLAINNVDTISATDGVLSWNADQFSHFILGNVAIDPDTFAILADTGADISALTATQIGEIAAKGVALIDATDGMLALSVAQFNALGAMSVDASADFTIADTGANLAGMSAGAIAALGSLGVDHLNATDNSLSLNIAQYQALGTVTLTAGDDVTLTDTSAHLQALTGSDLGDLGGNGIDHIDATDNVLTISLSSFNALSSVTLTQSDVVTLADSHATISSLSTGNIAALAAGGIDIFDATDNAISFTVAQYNETVADHVALTAGDTVTLADSGPTLSLLTAADINNLVNVDAVNATDNTLVIAVDQFEAFVAKNITLGSDDAVTISDTAANLATLDFSTLTAAHVDQLNSTTPFTSLTVANLAALGTVIFSGASSVTLTDSGANIAAVADFSTFAAHGVDTLDASDNTLTISEAQFQALGTTHLTGSDTVTISDTATNITFGPSYAVLAGAGIDFLNATTAINATVLDITHLGTVVFTAGSNVTLTDTGAHIAAVANFATFAAHGVDRIDATNNTLTISATQYGALGSVTLTAGDTVTISDTAAHLGGLTFSDLAAANVDFLNSTTAYTTLTVQNMTDLGAVHFTAASNVTLTDGAGNIQGVSDFTTYAAHGVDTIKSTDDQLSLTVSQFTGLGTTHLTGSDEIDLEDTAANLTAYLDSAGAQGALSTNGVDVIYATGGSMTVTAAEFSVVYGAGAVFSGPESFTLADTGANIAALDFTTLIAMGIDRIYATDSTLNVTVAQYLDVAGAVVFAAENTVTIADTAAHVEALTAGQIGALSTNFIDAVSVTSGGDLDWSVAQWQALPAGVSLSDTGYSLVVDDDQTTIEGLTGTQLGALAASGAQELASTDATLNFSVSQAAGFLGTGLSIAPGDAGTLSDAGTAIAGLTATQIGQLAAAGFDTINASDNALTLSVAQFSALGTVTLAGTDAVTLADTADNLNTYLHGNVYSALSSNDVNTIHATEGAISIDAQVVNNIAASGAAFATGDTVTLFDTGANIAALNFSVLPPLHVDTIDASDGVLNISLAQYQAIAGTVALTAADDVTVTGNMDVLFTFQIATFAANHVDHLLDNDGSGAVIWSVAQWNALTTAVTIDNAGHIAHANYVNDSAASLNAVTATQIANFVTEGAEVWAANDSNAVTWDVAKLEAMGASTFYLSAPLYISDTAANLEAISDYSIFSAHNVDTIFCTDPGLSLTVAQFGGLNGIFVDGSTALTLADTAGNLAAYLDGASAHGALSLYGVDFIHATEGTWSVDALAISHVAGTGAVFASGDAVTLSDTGANIAALDFSPLHGLNVDTIDANDDLLNISLTQYEAIAGVVALTVADNVTVTGNLDSLSATEIASFAANHVDHLLDNDGSGAVIWSVAQWNALTPAVTIDNDHHFAHANYVNDSAANLNAVTATQIANVVTEGAEVWKVSDAGTVTWDVAKLEAMGASTFYLSDHLTISDTAANLEAVSDYSIFASHNVDTIDSTDNTLSLTVAQFSALGTTTLTGADVVTLADTAANLSSYLDGAGVGAALSANGVDFIHATGGTLSVHAQAISHVAGTGAVFASGDTVVLADTGANIAALDFSVLHALNVDTIDATDNVLNISLAQYEAIAGTVALTVADYVTVTGNLDGLSAAEIAGFAANHVDHLIDDDGGSEVIWTVGQWDALTTAVTIDNIKQEAGLNLVHDTAASLSAATAAQIANFATEGAEVWRANDFGTVTWNVAQLEAMGASFWHATTVVISDTAANLELVSDYSIFANHGVTTISASDTDLSLTAAQFRGLGNAGVDSANTFTLADTAANIQAMGTHGYAAIAGKGVDFIHATDGSLTVTYAELNAIFSSGTVFMAADHVTLTGSQAELFDSQTAAYFTALGTQFHIDEISLTGGSGHLDVGQWNGLVAGSISLDSANTIALMDTAATLAGESAGAIAAMAGQIDSWAVSDSNTLVLSEAQLDALSAATVALTQSDTVELADTEAHIEALSGPALAAYIAQGVDIIHATGGTLNVNVSQVGAVIAASATFFGGDNVTLRGDAGSLNLLAVSDIAKLAAANVDHIFTTDFMGWSKAQFDALGTVTITSPASNIYLVDSEATLEALTVSDIVHYASLDIGHFIVTGSGSALNYSVAQALQIAASGILLQSQSSVGVFSVADTGTNIDALTAAQIATLSDPNFTQIDSTSGSIHWSESQFNALGGFLTLHAAAGSLVVLSDTEANLEALTASQIAAYAASGATEIDSSNNVLNLNLSQLDALSDAAIALSPDDTVGLYDTESNIEALDGTALAAYIAQGVDIIHATGGALNVSVSQVGAVIATTAVFFGGDNVTLYASASSLDFLAASDIGKLAAANVDHILTTDFISWNKAQFDALGTVTITNPASDIYLVDSEATLEALTVSDIAHYASLGIGNFLITSEPALNYSVAQALQIAASGIQLHIQTPGGVISVMDTGANIDALTVARIATLAAPHFTQIDSTSGSIHWSEAQFDALSGLTLHAVAGSQVVLSDTEANLEALTASQIAAYGASGATEIDSSSDVLNLSLSQLDALATAAIALTPADTVELADTESNIEALGAADLKGYVDQGVDVIHAGNSVLNLNAAQVAAVLDNGASFAAVDAVQLFDLASNIETLTAAQWGELVAGHVDAVGAVGGTLHITIAEFQAVEAALHSGSLTIVNPAVLRDTGAAISGLTATELGQLAGDNIGTIDATGGALTLTVAQYTALGTVALTASDTVTISDTAAHITTLDFSLLAAHNVDFLDVTDGFSLNVARYQTMGALKFAPSDTITLADTGANLAAMSATQFAALAGNGIDKIDATNDALSLTVAQYNALGTVTLTASDVVTLADTGAHLAALTAAQIGALAAGGIDKIDASDNALSLTVAKYQALGTVTLTATDTVTLADTGAHIQALTVAQIGALAGLGIDVIDSTSAALNLTVAQFGALGTVTLTASDSVVLLDTGAHLQTLNFATLASRNVDILDASDNVLALTAAQFQALGTVGLKSSDTVTLLDTGADISALTVGQFNALASKGIDVLDATDNAYSLSAAQVNGLGALKLAASDTVTMSDTEANIESETSGNFTTAATAGIDFIHSTSNIDHITVAQVTPLLGTTTAFATGDTVTLIDSGANIATLTAAQIGQLAAAGVDKIDATDDTVGLTVAQYRALGTVTLASGDTNTIFDNDTNIDSLTTGELAGLAAAHVGAIHSSFAVVWTAAQWNALPGSVHVSSVFGASGVELIGSADVINALTAAQISSYAAEGLGALQGFNGDLTLSVSQATTILADLIIVGNDDGIFLTDTGSAIAGLSAAQISQLSTVGFQAVDATDNALTLSVAQFQALNGVTLTAGDTVTVADTETNVEALTNAQLSAMRDGSVDIIHSTSGVLNVATAQVGALLGSGTHFAYGDAVTLFDSGTTISTLTPLQFSGLGAAGIDTIDASDNSLTLTVAQYQALGTVQLSAGDTNTLSDTSAVFHGMSTTDIAGLDDQYISHLHSSDGVQWSLAQWNALASGIAIDTATGGVSLYDTEAHDESLTVTQINNFHTAGLNSIVVSDTSTLDFTVAQTAAILSDGIVLSVGGPGVAPGVVADTGAHLATLSLVQIGQLAAAGFNSVDATNDSVAFNRNQVDALGAGHIALTAGDSVTMNVNESNMEAFTATTFANYIARGVDIFHSTSSILALNESQVAAVMNGGAAFKDTDAVTLSDTAAHLQSLTATQFGQLAATGVDLIFNTSGTLSLSVADYLALGAFTIVGGSVALTDSSANIATLTATQLAALTTGTSISHIDASDNMLALNVADVRGVLNQTSGGTVTFDAGDALTVADTGANLGGLTAAELTSLAGDGAGSVTLDAGDNALTISLSQYNAIVGGSIALTAGDAVTLADTGANLAALTAAQLAALSAQNIDAIDATDNKITFTLAQYNALGGLQTAANDLIKVNGTNGDDTISGTANSDILVGGKGNDALSGQGGDDTLSGGPGNNTLDGGAGTDTVTYAWSTTGVTVNLLTGTASNGTGTDTLTSIENVTGSSGNDMITAGTGVNVLSGGIGDDTFIFGAYLTAADRIDGGTGNDTVTLNGDYSAGVTFAATTMVNVETLTLAAGHSYALTTVDATVASGATMTVDGSALGSLDVLTFSGTHETDGNYIVTGGAGADHISTGAGNDTINGGTGDDVLAPGSGNDTVNAGNGNDTIYMYGYLTDADHIDGGTGSDTVRFNGDYSAGVALGAATITNVETFLFAAGFNYKITTNDSTVASGQTLTANASALGVNDKLTFDGSAETNGNFFITGGLGGDDLTGGAGADRFIYTNAAQSSSVHFDTIHNLNFSADRIDTTATITAIDAAVNSGSLSTATFDTDLASDMSGHLGVHHALLFTAAGGTLAGQTFLVIDINGVAGYQAGQDLVIDLAGHSGSLAVSDFI